MSARGRVAWLLALGVALLAACGPSEAVDAGPERRGVIARDGGLFLPRDAGASGDGGALDGGDEGPPALCPPDDELEDNDDRLSAHAVTSGEEVHATFCGGDDDWFQLQAQRGCQIEVRLDFDPAGGDLDLSLYSPSGTLVGSSNTVGASELISVTATAAGSFAARVRGVGVAATRYTIRLSATCASALSCPADDEYEDNDEQLFSRAVQEDVPLVGIVCPDDDDWYSVTTPPGCAAVAHLDFVHSTSGDLDLRFHRPDGSPGGRSLSVTDDERAVEGGSATGPLAVRVYGVGGDTNTYKLTIDRVCAGSLTCPSDDPFEPNDERGESHTLYPPVRIPGIVCGADEDWYRVSIASGCTLEVGVDFAHADGDLDVQLRNSQDAILAQGSSTDDDETLSYTAPSATTGYLRVFLFQDAGSPRYQLSATTSCPEAP